MTLSRFHVHHLDGDMSNEADVQNLVATTIERFGQLDALINCAGMADSFKPTLEQDMADFRRLVDVHFSGAYLMCKAVVPQMLRQRRGALINLSSIAGALGLARRNAYSAAKAGIGIGMVTRTLGCEWAAQGIRVNTITPGYRLTPFMQKLVVECKLDADQVRRRTPAGRLGSAQNIADSDTVPSLGRRRIYYRRHFSCGRRLHGLGRCGRRLHRHSGLNPNSTHAT